MFQYSSELIELTIKVFKEENDLDISEETANEYLNSFAGLYLAFAKNKVKGGWILVKNVGKCQI